ncbi:hypothetical protein D3C80_1180240 [compost metagenome]
MSSVVHFAGERPGKAVESVECSTVVQRRCREANRRALHSACVGELTAVKRQRPAGNPLARRVVANTAGRRVGVVVALNQPAVANIRTAQRQGFTCQRPAVGQRWCVQHCVIFGNNTALIIQRFAERKIQHIGLNIAAVKQIVSLHREALIHLHQPGVVELIEIEIQRTAADQLSALRVCQVAGDQRQAVVTLHGAGVGKLRGIERKRFCRQLAVVKQLCRRQLKQILAEHRALIIEPPVDVQLQTVQRLHRTAIGQRIGS